MRWMRCEKFLNDVYGLHKKEHPPASKMLKKWRCHPDSDRGMKVLQTFIAQDVVGNGF